MQSILNYPEDDEYWNSIFEKAVLEPQSWIQVAIDLTKSLFYLRKPAIDFFKAIIDTTPAQTLPIEKGVHASYLMIAAYATENLMKAIIAKKATDSGINSPQPLLKELKTHDLRQLATKAGILLNDNGSELLARMTYFSVWAARYPAPLAVNALKPQPISNSYTNTLRCIRGSDIRGIDEILNHCSTLLSAPNIIQTEHCGYNENYEKWEGVLMHTNVKPW